MISHDLMQINVSRRSTVYYRIFMHTGFTYIRSVYSTVLTCGRIFSLVSCCDDFQKRLKRSGGMKRPVKRQEGSNISSLLATRKCYEEQEK
jgi:hypothetical protein